MLQAEDGIRDLVRSRGLGDVYKRQVIEAEIVGHKGSHRRCDVGVVVEIAGHTHVVTTVAFEVREDVALVFVAFLIANRVAAPGIDTAVGLSLIHICSCRRSTLCRSRWSPSH